MRLNWLLLLSTFLILYVDAGGILHLDPFRSEDNNHIHIVVWCEGGAAPNYCDDITALSYTVENEPNGTVTTPLSHWIITPNNGGSGGYSLHDEGAPDNSIEFTTHEKKYIVLTYDLESTLESGFELGIDDPQWAGIFTENLVDPYVHNCVLNVTACTHTDSVAAPSVITGPQDTPLATRGEGGTITCDTDPGDSSNQNFYTYSGPCDPVASPDINVCTSDTDTCPVVPTVSPTDAPTSTPTDTPTTAPTTAPTNSPSMSPTNAPFTQSPTTSPIESGACTQQPDPGECPASLDLFFTNWMGGGCPRGQNGQFSSTDTHTPSGKTCHERFIQYATCCATDTCDHPDGTLKSN